MPSGLSKIAKIMGGDRAVEDYKPPEKATEKTAKTSRHKQSAVAEHAPSVGARLTPAYLERKPDMWAVGEVDVQAISLSSFMANAAFSFASFCLGFTVNIVVDYMGAEKLTEVGGLMLHRIAPLIFLASVVFFVAGVTLNRKRDNIWEQIKKESTPKQPQQ
ncbi:MAG TPA: hypothetical protein VKB58_16115 [Terriglobales bacterium]|nr:hypothetical protein [Terriglobales bacterium]